MKAVSKPRGRVMSPEAIALKKRMMDLLPLPPSYAKKFVSVYPEFNTLIGADKVRNVANLKLSPDDVHIVEKFETLFPKS